MTHIDNMPHILKHGLVKKDSPLHDEQFVSIGDRQIIDRRSEMKINGYRLGDYIPFYLGPRSPMLYVIQHGYNGVTRVDPENIVYCVIKISDLIHDDIDCVFTDGHALTRLTSFYEKYELSRIDEIIRYEDVYSDRWNSDEDIDLKRRKEAELLVRCDLPEAFICGYVVYDDIAKQRLLDLGINAGKIAVEPRYYY